MKKTLILLGMAAALLVSCKDKNNDDNGAREREQARQDSLNANKKVDNFLYDIMSDYYLWNSNLPGMQEDESRYPADFFESLLYRTKDRWSFCVEDGESYMAEDYSTQEQRYRSFAEKLDLEDLIETLGPLDREIVNLLVQGYTVSEIAKLQDRSYQLIRNRIYSIQQVYKRRKYLPT